MSGNRRSPFGDGQITRIALRYAHERAFILDEGAFIPCEVQFQGRHWRAAADDLHGCRQWLTLEGFHRHEVRKVQPGWGARRPPTYVETWKIAPPPPPPRQAGFTRSLRRVGRIWEITAPNHGIDADACARTKNAARWGRLEMEYPALYQLAWGLHTRYPALNARPLKAAELLATGHVHPAPFWGPTTDRARYLVRSQSRTGRAYAVHIPPDDRPGWSCTIHKDPDPARVGQPCPDHAHGTAPQLTHGRRCKHMAAAYFHTRLTAPALPVLSEAEGSSPSGRIERRSPVGEGPVLSAAEGPLFTAAELAYYRERIDDPPELAHDTPPPHLRRQLCRLVKEPAASYAVGSAEGEGATLYQKARAAVRCAVRRLHEKNVTLTPADREDMIQEAAATYARLRAQGRDDRYAFVSAIYEALECWARQCRGHNPYALSLDWTYDDGKPWLERLRYDRDSHDQTPASGWLPEASLRNLVGDAAALHYTRWGAATIRYDTAVLRLLLEGYDTAAIAVELGKSENAIKQKRKKLKQMLLTYCQHVGIEPPTYNRNGGGWRPAHAYRRPRSRGRRSSQIAARGPAEDRKQAA